MTNIDLQINTYEKQSCVSFRKTKESYGGLSNMCSGYPIKIDNHIFLTSESLYQSCRFNEYSDIQRIILNEKSPMSSKMKSKKYISNTRSDWDNVRIDIMNWCIRMKLKSNWNEFGNLLLSTGEQPIVEDSHKDRFWGGVLEDEYFVGRNILGKLLMNLRDDLKNKIINQNNLNFEYIEGMKFFGVTFDVFKVIQN